jgi:uncharacterized membrane protein YfcA
MNIFNPYAWNDLLWIAFSLVLSGMSKGGFPVGLIATPLLILAWPEQSHAARAAVGFMLPMLCLMDLGAFLIYRRNIEWQRLRYLWPGALVGIGLASLLFVSDETALLAVSDQTLKACIGILGLLFLTCGLLKNSIPDRLSQALQPGWTMGSVFGFSAGLTSTLAHAAAPVMQMYLLPQQLDKKHYVGTNGAYFFVINLVKILPFAMLGRINSASLKLNLALSPILPFGILLGWWLTHKTRQDHFILLIYATLFTTSVLLIAKAARLIP